MDTELLFVALVGFYQALGSVLVSVGRRSGRVMYPGIVEFGLYSDEIAFLFVLGAKDLELGGFQWAVGVLANVVDCWCLLLLHDGQLD